MQSYSDLFAYLRAQRRLLPCHFKVVEVEAEVDACAKMLHRFKHLSGLSYFVNVSDVSSELIRLRHWEVNRRLLRDRTISLH